MTKKQKTDGRQVKPGRAEELENFCRTGVPIAKSLGMTLNYDAEHRAVVKLAYNPGFDHGLGGIHGGVYMTLLDTAAWFTSAVTHEPDVTIATSEMAVHFFKPSSETDLTARGTILKSGKRQDIVEVHLYDGNEELVGHAVGTFIILPKPG